MNAAIQSLPAPPRRVVSRSGASRFGRWFFRLFLLPHTLAGIIGLFAVPFLFLWAIAGTVVQAEIVDKRTGMRHVGKNNRVEKRYWEYVYSYTFAGEEYRKSGAFGPAEFNAMPTEPSQIAALHRVVPVRVFGIGRYHYADRASENPWKTVGLAVLFVAFWNTVVGLFFYGIWIAPFRERQLVANGLVRPGRVVEILSGNKGTSRIVYEYQADGRPFRHQVSGINNARLAAHPAGSPVTVLAYPFNEKRSLIYELGNYQIEGERL